MDAPRVLATVTSSTEVFRSATSYNSHECAESTTISTMISLKANSPASLIDRVLMNRSRIRDDASIESNTSLQRNRKVVNKYLKKFGRQAKLELTLDVHGFCYIPFKKFLIIIGVPDDGSGLLNFQTMVFDLDSSRGITKVHKRVAAANLTELSLGTKGSTLTISGDEISLILSVPIQGLRFNDMLACLEDFMQTAVETNANLESIR